MIYIIIINIFIFSYCIFLLVATNLLDYESLNVKIKNKTHKIIKKDDTLNDLKQKEKSFINNF